MKLSTKFLLLMTFITAAFCIGTAAAVMRGLEEIRRSEYNAVAAVAGAVKKKYPEIKDREIVELLNSGYGGQETEELLRRYGIEKNQYMLREEKQSYSAVISLAVCSVLAFGATAVMVISVYGRVKTRREKELTRYLARINSGDYSLVTKKLTENSDSVLQSEIYKTTVMLREKSEQLREEKEHLKDSLSDISHQLKTPLTSMTIMIDNILEGDMPEDIQKEFLGDIKKSVEHLRALTQALLTLSKLDADTIEFRRSLTPVRTVLETSVNRTAAIASEGGVEVTLECDGAELECDPKWTCEAITNVIKNCIEHTPKGGRVMIKCEDTPLLVRLEISDTGSGIDKRDLPHIFERFYKGRNSGENSVGIGLAMAKAITEKDGGYITVSSEKDKGSRFVIKYFKNAEGKR